MKLCEDCKWLIPAEVPQCNYPTRFDLKIDVNKKGLISLISDFKKTTCSHQRSPYNETKFMGSGDGAKGKHHHAYCGPQGKFWEPKK